jgi:hypothetical protein
VPTQLEQAANCRQKIDQARATIDREAAKLTKLLAKIRADCPHLNLIEISMFDLRYYRQTRRMCIDCGIIEVSDFMGHYRILKGEIEFTCKSSKVFEKHCPFGCCEIWTVCENGYHSQWHAVPRSQIAGDTRKCQKHLGGKLCPTCRGRGSWWYSYGLSGGGGGRWTKCDTCDSTGVIKTKE